MRDKIASIFEDCQELSLPINLLDILVLMQNILLLRDTTTAEHSLNVSQLCQKFGRHLDLPPEDIMFLSLAGLLHDLGKVSQADNILLSTSQFTPPQRESMQDHPLHGGNVLRNFHPPFSDIIAPIVEQHHENWNGSGYPHRLEGRSINPLARILSLCDTWDAMRSDRPYRHARPYEESLQEIQNGSGTQFEPQLATRFLRFISKKNRETRLIIRPDSG